MYRVYLFVIGICICCPLIGAKEPLPLLADPTPTVTLDMKRVPLQDILLEIEKQTGLFFSYESSMLKEFRHVSLTARDESLSYCLKRLFEPLPLVYRITGRYVILKRKPRQYTISGFVRDSVSYESLIAATVVADYLNVAATGGESFAMQYRRVSDFLDELKGKPYQQVAVFAHGGVLICAQIYAGIIKPEEAFSALTPYGGIVRITL